MHGIEQGARFILDLVRHPAFPTGVRAIVVEFGNAHHQALADRYVAGEDVSPRDMQRIWRDVVGAVPWGLRRAIYPEFFAAVREVNEGMPPARRIRVLLGDPPVDWPNVRSPDDLQPAMLARDEHFAGVVERQVLARGQRALLLSGGYHLMRGSPIGLQDGNVTELLERAHPDSVFVISPHPHVRRDCPSDHHAAIEARIAAWPVPGLAELRGTWLGALTGEQVFGHLELHRTIGGVTTRVIPFGGSAVTLAELADAYLFLGPAAAYTWSKFELTPDDDADRAEIERRDELFRAPAES
jgi:hypothetical protein